MADANVYDGGCKRLRERMQTFEVKRGSALQGRMLCTARTDAVHCGDGCSALRERLQYTASKMGKTGTEIASPILDKRTRRRDAPVAPWKYLLYHKTGAEIVSPILDERKGGSIRVTIVPQKNSTEWTKTKITPWR